MRGESEESFMMKNTALSEVSLLRLNETESVKTLLFIPRNFPFSYSANTLFLPAVSLHNLQ